MRENTWLGDWVTRIYHRVRAQGFDSVTAFANANPKATLLELAAQLGADVAAIQLEGVLHSEAEAKGAPEQFARDLLVRNIRHHLPVGWIAGKASEFARAGAYASWAAAVEGLIGEAASDAIWDALEDSSIPTGWLPSGPDDPIIERAFAGVRFDAPAGEG
jgi:hypothetical protein